MTLLRDPAYLRIERYVRDLIDQGGGRSAPLPAEPELEERFGVSRMTVRHAFQRLVAGGLVVRYPGKGSFASPQLRVQLRIDRRADPPDQWALQGRNTAVKVLAFEVRSCPDPVAEQFGIDLGTRLAYLERVRYADGRPMSWDRRWMPAGAVDAVGVEELKRVSLLVALPDHGYPISRGLYEIVARIGDAEEARMLEIDARAPVLERRLTFMDPDDRLVVTGSSLYAASRVTYRVNVTV